MLADAAWLESLGFNHTHNKVGHDTYIAPDESFVIEVTIEGDGGSALWCCGKPVCDNPTRDQVTALFKGLQLQYPNGSEP